MTESTHFPDFINTYQRVLLSDWQTMAKLIFKHSALLKHGGYKEQEFNDDPTNVLTEGQITDALQGPYSAFFLMHIKSFSQLAQWRMAAHIDKEDSLKDNLHSLDPELKINPKKLEALGENGIKELEEEFNELVENHCQQWEGQLFFWQMSITGALRSEGLDLAEIESDDFAAPEPVSELREHYQSLNLEPMKVSYPLSFADYFRLKVYLLIHSALSRQHLPHDDKAIQKHVKALKRPLHEIEKAEKNLLNEQQAAITELLSPIRAR